MAEDKSLEDAILDGSEFAKDAIRSNPQNFFKLVQELREMRDGGRELHPFARGVEEYIKSLCTRKDLIVFNNQGIPAEVFYAHLIDKSRSLKHTKFLLKKLERRIELKPWCYKASELCAFPMVTGLPFNYNEAELNQLEDYLKCKSYTSNITKH